MVRAGSDWREPCHEAAVQQKEVKESSEAQGNQRGHQTCPVWLRLEQGRVLCSGEISQFTRWGVNSRLAWSVVVAEKNRPG